MEAIHQVLETVVFFKTVFIALLIALLIYWPRASVTTLTTFKLLHCGMQKLLSALEREVYQESKPLSVLIEDVSILSTTKVVVIIELKLNRRSEVKADCIILVVDLLQRILSALSLPIARAHLL